MAFVGRQRMTETQTAASLVWAVSACRNSGSKLHQTSPNIHKKKHHKWLTHHHSSSHRNSPNFPSFELPEKISVSRFLFQKKHPRCYSHQWDARIVPIGFIHHDEGRNGQSGCHQDAPLQVTWIQRRWAEEKVKGGLTTVEMWLKYGWNVVFLMVHWGISGCESSSHGLWCQDELGWLAISAWLGLQDTNDTNSQQRLANTMQPYD